MNVFPRQPPYDLINIAIAYSVSVGELSSCLRSIEVGLNNLYYLNLVKSMSAYRLSMRNVMTTLFNGIHFVVFVGSQKQVRRIYTTRIIAMVAHYKTIWNWSFEEHPRQSASYVRPIWFKATKSPVSVFVNAAIPRPTNVTRKARNVFKKSFSKGLYFRHKQNAHQPEKVIPANGGRSLQKVGKSFAFSILRAVSRLSEPYSILRERQSQCQN